MDQWKGKVAVVCGSSSGMGRAIAIKLAEDGMTVAALARRQNKLQELEESFKGKGKIKGYVCDNTNESQVEEVFNKIQKDLGKIRVLVNTAGGYHQLKFGDLNIDKWKDMMEAHFYGMFICIKYLTKLVQKEDPGPVHVVNVNTAKMTGNNMDMMLPYYATKIPPKILTYALVKEFAKNKINIKITGLDPGTVRTEIVLEVAGEHPEMQGFLATTLKPSNVGEAVEMIICAPENTIVTAMTMHSVGEVF